VVDKVRSTFGREPLLPSLRQRSGTGLSDGSASGRDDTATSRSGSTGRSRRVLPVGVGRVRSGPTARVEHVIGQTPQVVPRSSVSGRVGSVGIIGHLIRTGTVPRRRPGVVIDVVLPSEMVDPPLPPFRQGPKMVHMGIKVAVVPSRRSASPVVGSHTGRSRLRRRVGRRRTQSASRVLVDGGYSRSRVGHLSHSLLPSSRSRERAVGSSRRRHLRRRITPRRVRGRTRRSRTDRAPAARRRSGVLDRSRRVGRHVQDQLAVNRQVLARLFQVPREHLYRAIASISLLSLCQLGFVQERLLRLTLPTTVQIDHIGHLDIDHSQKPLILSLELSLIKHLHGDYRRVLDITIGTKRQKKTLAFAIKITI
jgi:hypothetical protein